MHCSMHLAAPGAHAAVRDARVTLHVRYKPSVLFAVQQRKCPFRDSMRDVRLRLHISYKLTAFHNAVRDAHTTLPVPPSRPGTLSPKDTHGGPDWLARLLTSGTIFPILDCTTRDPQKPRKKCPLCF